MSSLFRTISDFKKYTPSIEEEELFDEYKNKLFKYGTLSYITGYLTGHTLSYYGIINNFIIFYHSFEKNTIP